MCRNSMGIEVYAFGIRTREPEKYYGEDNFVYVKDGSKIDREVISRFSSIIVNGRIC